MKKENLIWLAGIFEGEGTTGLYKYNNGGWWRITTYFMVSNNDPVIIDEIYKIGKELGINMLIAQKPENPQANHNLNYKILTKKMSECYILLETLLPYIRGGKKVVAILTMRFIKSRNFGNPKKGPGSGYSETDKKLYTMCKEYNQRGINKKTLESSETIRQTLKTLGDDIVRTSMKVGEWVKPD